MKENELRIGNYVIEKGKIKPIHSVSNHNAKDYSKIEPIPLTEEILVNWCGFTKKGINRTKFTFWKIDLVEDEKGVYSFDESRIYIDIEYVHQLQNLYFALTGEELTINRPSAK